MLLCGFPACAFRAADRGCQPAPGLPCALLDKEGGATRQSSGEMRREAAKACLQFKMRAGECATASYSVIASAAKQSSLPPRKDSGLLRSARKDALREC